jgi:hypothetical protein
MRYLKVTQRIWLTFALNSTNKTSTSEQPYRGQPLGLKVCIMLLVIMFLPLCRLLCQLVHSRDQVYNRVET